MNRKHTKRALFSSVLALVLCFSMMLGTTFAWFTDSVTSTNNIIKAGNLDVELEYAKVVDGKIEDWAPVKEGVKVFDQNALWEPGRVEVVYLKVSNLGTLQLKYQLGVNVAEEKTGISVKTNEEFKLSDYLVFKVVEMPDALTTYTDREAVEAAAGTEKGLKDYNGKTTKLDAKGGTNAEDYVALIVYMPETVENEANYKTGTEAPFINLGVKLYATQVEAEEDSFGKDYDKDAWVDGMKVYSANDLQAAIEAGEDVVLMNDIAATEVIELANNTKIDLNGKKLTANITVAKDADVVITDGVIASASPDSSPIETVGNLTLNNVAVSSDRHGVRVEGGETVINGGTYTAAGYAGRTQHALNVSDGGVVIVNGGTFIGPKGTASDSGSAVNVQAGSSVTINGGNFSGGKNKTLSAAGTLTVKGGTFDQDPSAYVDPSYKAVDNGNGTYSVIFPQESFDNLINNAQPGDTVNVPAGDFTLSGNNELVIVGNGEDTVITVDGSIKNANISNATVAGNNRLAVGGGQSAVFNNVVFEGQLADWSSVNGDTTFTGCTFNGLLHIDASAETATVKFVDCTFDELCVIKLGGSAKYIMENCVVETLDTTAVTSPWGRQWLITYSDLTMTECELGRVIRAGKKIVITLNDCVDVDGNAVSADIVHENSAPVVVVNGIKYAQASSQGDLESAVTSGDANVTLGAGEYTLPSASNSDVTISGDSNTVITVNKPAFHGSDVTMNGVTVQGSGYATGVQHVNTVTYNEATIKGEMCLYGEKVVFNDCTFELNGQYIWTYGAKVVEFNNCTFNTTGKAILIYNEGAGASNVTVKNCTFNASAGAKAGAIANQNCAAIEIDNFQNSGTGVAHTLITSGNTYDSNFSGEWRIKNFVTGNAITVNGIAYTSIAIDGKTMTIDASKNVTVNP